MLAGSYCPAETVTTGVYVIGGSETTEDAPYLLTDAFLSQTCTVHNEFNSTYTGTNSFPGSTGVNPIGADPAGDAATPDASTTTRIQLPQRIRVLMVSKIFKHKKC